MSEAAELVIGDRVCIGSQVAISVAISVQIGNDVMFASPVAAFDNPSHPLSPQRRLRHEPFSLEDASSAVIEDNVWLGTGSMVLRGVRIGEDCVVAAGSIVTRDVPPNSLVAGAPAVVKKHLEPDS